VDAARAFGTGCFKEHRTHDLRGLSESELQSVEHWKQFFRDHKSYYKVGRVNHPPIDPSSPLPPHCDPKAEAAQRARWGAAPPSPVAPVAESRHGEEHAQVKKNAVGVEPELELELEEIQSRGQAHEEL
jgi:hypothetical protein